MWGSPRCDRAQGHIDAAPGLEPPSEATGEVSIDIEATYARHGPIVIRRCRSLLRDEERAVAALHDTFVRLLRGRDRLTDDRLSSLLWRVATNACLKQLRSQRRRPEDPDDRVLLEIAELDDTEKRTLASRVG